MNKQYKDKCDKCHQMKVCKGFKGFILCEVCIKKELNKPIEIVGDKDGQTRFNI